MFLIEDRLVESPNSGLNLSYVPWISYSLGKNDFDLGSFGANLQNLRKTNTQPVIDIELRPDSYIDKCTFQSLTQACPELSLH